MIAFGLGVLSAQKTSVFGVVTEQASKSPIPFVKVSFYGSKISTITDSLGRYKLETYYPVDSLQIYSLGYKVVRIKLKQEVQQEVNAALRPVSREVNEIVVLPPDEFPSTKLHKKIIAHKPVNNKEKLQAYQYEAYNKFQVDINNIGSEFSALGPVKRLNVVLDYLDTSTNQTLVLPAVLAESVSDFYFANRPKRKREVVKASRITGVENLQAAQFLGDMYLDINIYENVIDLFGKSFISPLANYARSMYRFYLDDSTYIGNKFCYKLRFEPKNTSNLTFYGEMWVHDTTYAIQSIKANISEGANLNYIQDLYVEQEFEQVEQEVWMLKKEILLLDIRLTEKTKIYGFLGKKTSSRKRFIINELKPDDFYNTSTTVEFLENSKTQNIDAWDSLRHETLNKTENGISEMIDTLNKTTYFQRLRTLTYFASTGYYPLGKIELGNATSLISRNPVEDTRLSLAIRTSNAFSKRLELGGKIGYGIGDDRFKYSSLIRFNITPKKRGMLSTYFSYDLEQIGQSPTAAQLGNTFATVLNTAPFDKLTFVKKIGFNLEKDLRKDLIILGGFDWKDYTPLGISTYLSPNLSIGGFDTLRNLTTAEIITRIRWTKDEEFLSGQFDRTSVGSSFPILSLQCVIGVKGIAGSMYNYQKLEFQLEHYTQLGALGRLRYGTSMGCVFGSTAFPFLKVHEGNQSYWLLLSSYNKMNFLEFISDKYASAFIENHWEGLFFNKIPGINKLNLRFVSTARVLYGTLSSRHADIVIIPDYVKSFGQVPYVECSAGLENVFKVLRVDFVWRATHNVPGTSPFGVRGRISFNF
jgi:hypothetical protein